MGPGSQAGGRRTSWCGPAATVRDSVLGWGAKSILTHFPHEGRCGSGIGNSYRHPHTQETVDTAPVTTLALRTLPPVAQGTHWQPRRQ